MIITRCPACHTAFRVSPEQLALRNGRVRCGHCYRPFDAREHRIADDALDQVTLPPVIQSRRTRKRPPRPEAPPPTPTPTPAPEPAPPAFEFPLPDPEPTPPAAPARPEPEATAWPEPATGPEPEPDFAPESGYTPVPPSPWVPLDDATADARESRYRRSGARAPRLDDDLTAHPPDDTSETDTAAEPDAAVEHWRADAYAPPGTPARHRWLWALCIGMLLGALGAQASYIWRETITREFPQLRPLYLAACARLGCDVPLPRIARQIAIEHSALGFDPDDNTLFELQAVLRNRADHPQQLPHIELTLTNLDDQPLARRALAPAEWAPKGRDAAAGIAPGERIRITLPFTVHDLDPESVTGYRVVAFYP